MIRNDVRVRDMETASTLTITGQTVALPDNFLAVRRFYLECNKKALDMVSPDMLWDDPRSCVPGEPEIYAIEGSSLVFAPYPSSSLYGNMLYWRGYAALSSDDDTHWLLTNPYDVDLCAALSQSKAFIEDDEQAGKWASAYSLSVDKLQRNGRRSRYSGTALRSGGCPV